MNISLEFFLFLLGCFFVLSVGVFAMIWARRAREQRTLDQINRIGKRSAAAPPTLHPVFDPTRCIGSGTCTRVCPQGNDVIGLVHGRGALIDPSMCIGHGRCAEECPTGAIRLVFGTAERGVDIPHLSTSFETNVEGIYIAGELGGMGLIANAVEQSVQAMGHVKTSLAAKKTPEDSATEAVDVAIVGAGPAGLTAALFAIQHGLSYRLFDKESVLGGSILHYPRRKLVVTRPVIMPLLGKVHTGNISKEQLIALWTKSIKEHDVHLETNAQVESIEREPDGLFTLKTANGQIARSRKVLLTIGRRGTPRKLGVKGEISNRVTYSLLDPTIYEGRKVVVVGGGESAIETCLALVEETSAEVVLSHLQETIASNNALNQGRLDRALKNSRFRIMGKSKVQEIADRTVVLALDTGTIEIPADDVIVQAGGELPIQMLKRAGIQMSKYFGEETEDASKSSSIDLFKEMRDQAKGKRLHDFRKHRLRSNLGVTILALVMACFLGAALFLGRSHYLGHEWDREGLNIDPIFHATGIFGHTLGVMAIVAVLINLLYFARKELGWLKRLGNIRTWMNFHMLFGLGVGAMSMLHTSFILKNIFAATLYICLGLVILTGVIGRYIYAFIPHDPRGRPLTHEALVSLSKRMRLEFDTLFEDLRITVEIDRVLDRGFAQSSTSIVVLFRLVFLWPIRSLQLYKIIRRARRELTGDRKNEFVTFAKEMFLLRMQMDLFSGIRRLFGPWRYVHGSLALLLIFLVAAHAGIQFWVGYRWIF